MNKQELIDKTKASWRELQAQVAGLSDEQLREPGVAGGWSAKDVLAHISSWERMFIGWMEALMRGERPDRPEFIDEEWTDRTNARLYEENRDKALDEVVRESKASHDALVGLIDGLSEEALFDPNHFPWARGRDIAPWVRGNGDEHYDEHIEQLRAWRQAHA